MKKKHQRRRSQKRGHAPITKTFFTFCFYLVILIAPAQVPIPPDFYGANYWFTDYTGAPFITTSVTPLSSTKLSLMSATGVRMMRVGGTAYDISPSNITFPHTGTYPNFTVTPAGYVKIVDDVRSSGFEPMIEVPFDDRTHINSIAEQAATAAEIVRTVNITHGRKVKYWIVGNEPEVDQAYSSTLASAQRVRDYILKYSVEMKKVDPTISIIGPELNSNDAAFLNPLFSTGTGSNSIAGTIPSTFQAEPTGGASGKYFVDYLSFHLYSDYSSAFSSSTDVRQSYTDAAYSYSNTLAGIYSSYVSGSGRSSANLGVILDEFNMDGAQVYSSSSASVDIVAENKSGNTFLAGQLMADMIGGMLSASDGSGNAVYAMCNPWSIAENVSLGLLNGTVPKPTYWHYFMMANYFKGVFYRNIKTPYSITDLRRCFRAYACKSKDYVAVLMINQATSSSTTSTNNSSGVYTFSLDFNSGSTDHSFAMGNAWGTKTITLANKSTSLVLFDCSGNIIYRLDLKESDIAPNASSYTLNDGTHPSGFSAPSLPSASASSSVICKGSTTSLSASSASAYDWYKLPDLSTSLGTGSTLSGATAGTYAVKLTGSCGYAWSTVVVQESSPVISPTVSYVSDCSSSSVNLTVQNGSSSYTWNPGAITGTNVSVSPTTTTVYSVSSTASGCSTTETLNVIVTDASSQKLWMKDDANDLWANEPNSTAGGIVWTART